MYLRKVFAGITLVAYSSLVLFGLLSSHHHGASMASCPYMVGQHSICEMNAMAHLEAWKVVSTSVLPILKLLPLTSVILALVFLWSLSPPQFSLSKQRFKTTFSSLHQRLFSQGILHPKAP